MNRPAMWCMLRVLMALPALLAGGLCGAQAYPTKPVRFIVPFAAGGASDIIARVIQPKLGEGLGQPVVMDNRGGAAGIIKTLGLQTDQIP